MSAGDQNYFACRAVQMSIRFDSSTISLDSSNYGGQTLYKICLEQKNDSWPWHRLPHSRAPLQRQSRRS